MDRLWEEMVDGLRPEDMPEAFARVDAIPDDDVRHALRNAIVDRGGQIDPRAALAWVDSTYCGAATLDSREMIVPGCTSLTHGRYPAGLARASRLFVT